MVIRYIIVLFQNTDFVRIHFFQTLTTYKKSLNLKLVAKDRLYC